MGPAARELVVAEVDETIGRLADERLQDEPGLVGERSARVEPEDRGAPRRLRSGAREPSPHARDVGERTRGPRATAERRDDRLGGVVQGGDPSSRS